MYLSIKVLSKIMNEVTYSWRMFKEILKQILTATIREMAADALNTKKRASDKAKVVTEDQRDGARRP